MTVSDFGALISLPYSQRGLDAYENKLNTVRITHHSEYYEFMK